MCLGQVQQAALDQLKAEENGLPVAFGHARARRIQVK